MNKYIARWAMVSELTMEEISHLHNNELRYRNYDNWFAVSKKFLWDKFPNGFFSKDLKDNVKKQRLADFENELKKEVFNTDIFDKYMKHYDNRKQMFFGEFYGGDLKMDEVQKIDILVHNKLNFRIDRQGYKSKTSQDVDVL